jgi:hypothetical protein
MAGGSSKTVFEFTGAAADTGGGGSRPTFVGGGSLDLSRTPTERESNLRSGATTWIFLGFAVIALVGVFAIVLFGRDHEPDGHATAEPETPAAEAAPAATPPAETKTETPPAPAVTPPTTPAPTPPTTPAPGAETTDPAPAAATKTDPPKTEPTAPKSDPTPAPTKPKSKPKPKPKPAPDDGGGTKSLKPKKPPRDPFADLPTPP